MMTDTQIYELRPDLKALNDEYVVIGNSLPELGTQIANAATVLTETQQQVRVDINAAIETVQAAQKQLKLVEAQSRTKIGIAQSDLEMLQSKQRHLIERRAEVQRLHNSGMDAVQKEHLIQQEIDESSTEVLTAEDVGELPSEINTPTE